MKFTCKQQTLSKALNIVSKAVTNKTTMEILKGILLKLSDDGKLTMSASDLDITIENTIEVEEYEPGEIVVYSKLFGDIIRKLPNDNVYVNINGTDINIKCKNSEFNIIGISSEEFPIIKDLEDEYDVINFNKEMLKEMIKRTSFAASIDESKGIITGILIEVEKNNLNMVAIDGYRMAITREDIICENNKKVIISAKNLNEISKILTELDTEDLIVKLLIYKKKAVFLIDNLKVVTRLLEGQFIKYKDILPKENKCEVIINRNEFLNSIERASLLSKEGKNNLIKINIEDCEMIIKSKSEEGEVTENIEIIKNGDNLTIGFNAKYVLDILKVIDDEKIKMLFNTNISPCMVEPYEKNNFEYLILPVRITNI